MEYVKIVLGVFLLLCTGCATMFPPKAERVMIQSDPSGAMVYIDGEARGITPLSLPLSCNPAPLVKLEREGFQSVENPMPRRSGWDGRLGVTWPAEKCADTFSVVLLPRGKKGR